MLDTLSFMRKVSSTSFGFIVLIFCFGAIAGYLVALWERQYYVWDQCTQWAQFFIQLYVGRFTPQVLSPLLGWPALSLSAVAGILASGGLKALTLSH